MPVKSRQELQTLNVQNLNLKTNIYGNIMIPPLNGGNKSISLETGVHLAEINGTDGQYASIQSVDGTPNDNKNLVNRLNSNGQSLLRKGDKSGINRYDSGYGSYNEFRTNSGTTFSETVSPLSSPLLETDQLNDIESINANNQYVITEWQSYTGEGLVAQQYSEPSTPTSPVGPAFTGKKSIQIPAAIPESPTVVPPGAQQKNKRNEYIRLVERFGTDLKDTCLFPLALPMDGSDVFKGKSDWTSISMLADCVLIKWLENSERHRQRTVNKVLPDAVKYMCPKPELQSRLLQCPDAKLPLRRTNSELDFHKLGFQERKGLVHHKGNTTGATKRQQSSDSSRRGSAATPGVRDDIDLNVGSEKGRFRANTSLSIRRKSVHFTAPPKSGKKDRFDLRVGGNLKTDAKALVQSIRLENPISLALQITKIEKELMTGLPSDEVMSLVLRKGKNTDAKSRLSKLIDFGHELSQLIADIIVREVTVEAQGKKIAALIEVGCVLRKLRNWQSLTSLIRGLQLPQIYGLSNAWFVTRAKYPIHFNDYLKLSQVVRNDSIAILRSHQPSIPSLSSFVALLRVRCLATWDLLDSQPRWTESPNLALWLERQMLSTIAIQESIVNSADRMAEAIRKKQKKQKQIYAIVEKFRETAVESHLDKCLKELSPEKRSFMPLNDPIYFIEDD
ncbi:unnamed protein product, partial [Oppiella nova]